jgi:hypothetical protein
MELEIVSIEKRRKFVSVGKTPMWVYVQYTLGGETMFLDFADEDQTTEQIVALVRSDAQRFVGAYQARITL